MAHRLRCYGACREVILATGSINTALSTISSCGGARNYSPEVTETFQEPEKDFLGRACALTAGGTRVATHRQTEGHLMWKRERRSLPASAAEPPASSAREPIEPTPAAPFGFDQTQGGQRTMNAERSNGKGFIVSEDRASIGKSIVVKGEPRRREDLTIEGTVEGQNEVRDHVLTAGENGQLKAEVAVKSIVVVGQVVGNLTATEKVDIKEKGSVERDITAPRLAIADGSNFKGSVDMPRREQTWNGDRAGSSRDNNLVRV